MRIRIRSVEAEELLEMKVVACMVGGERVVKGAEVTG